MRKRQSSYTCLTLLKQDIEEIVQLFQANLQDVEITIDNVRIADDVQLEQFGATYQATSFFARGFWHKLESGDPRDQDEKQPIELKVQTYRAMLQWLDWNTGRNVAPVLCQQIIKILLRCQNRSHMFMLLLSFMILCSLPLSLQTVATQHHVNDILQQLLLVVGATVLLVPLAVSLFAFFLRLLRRERLVFLFPGMVRTTRVYGRREAISQLVVALMLLVVLEFSLFIVLHLLWR